MTATSVATRPRTTPPEVIDLTRPAPLPGGVLADIAVDLARAPGVWRAHLDDRRRVRVVATGSYEVWVVRWDGADAPAALHDHGDSAAAVLVVEGELDEVRATGRRRLRPGAVAHVPVGVAHDIAPVGPATSVHVCSPPLATVGRYDGAGALVAVEPVAAEPAVHDAPSYVRALDSSLPAPVPAGG